MKDFTSVLAQNKDSRAATLAALREIYDGRWDRPVGSDGGHVLSWSGKCGLLGGCTPVLDRHHSVLSTLGDRFLLVRLADVDPAESGRLALDHVGRETIMRRELAAALSGIITGADQAKVTRALDEAEKRMLVALAAYAARARTGVDRDGYTMDVTVMPRVEGPGRLVTALRRLYGGLEAIGCTRDVAWRATRRVAMDCVPVVRTTLIRALLSRDTPVRTAILAMATGLQTKTTSRHLEDLALLGLAARTKTSDADNAPDLWAATPPLRTLWPASGLESPDGQPRENGGDTPSAPESPEAARRTGDRESPSLHTNTVKEGISVSLSPPGDRPDVCCIGCQAPVTRDLDGYWARYCRTCAAIAS